MEQNQSSPVASLPLVKYGAIVAVILMLITWLWLSGEEEATPQMRQPVPTQVEAPTQVVEEEPEPDFEPAVEPMIEPEAEPEEFETQELVSASTPEPEVAEIIEPAHPPLNESDDWLRQELASMLMGSSVIKLMMPKDNISNFVVFVDNAAKGRIVPAFSPLTEPARKFKVKDVEGQDYQYLLDPDSYKRYDPYANFIADLPVSQAHQLYQDLQPLLQQAYQELGYGEDDFDDKLLDTIELLLETPVIDGDIPLISPSVMYKFADPALEQLLPIQKLLLRMGPKNQRKIQSALKDFKAELLN